MGGARTSRRKKFPAFIVSSIRVISITYHNGVESRRNHKIQRGRTESPYRRELIISEDAGLFDEGDHAKAQHLAGGQQRDYCV